MRSFFLIILACISLVEMPAQVFAQAPAAPAVQAQPQLTEPRSGAGLAQGGGVAAAPKEKVGLAEIKTKMGPLFYPMVVLSLITVALIFFNAFTIRQNAVVSDAFMNAADALIRKQDYLGLLAVCNRRSECVARVTAKALDFATKNPTASFDEVREVTEAEGSRQASLILQRISYLGDVGAIAPMMGLLGTVFGLMTSFDGISGATGGAMAVGAAAGVHEALFCTAAGLIIGIPALILYAMYRGKSQRLVSELESASTHLMALLSTQYKRAARVAAGKHNVAGGNDLSS